MVWKCWTVDRNIRAARLMENWSFKKNGTCSELWKSNLFENKKNLLKTRSSSGSRVYWPDVFKSKIIFVYIQNNWKIYFLCWVYMYIFCISHLSYRINLDPRVLRLMLFRHASYFILQIESSSCVLLKAPFFILFVKAQSKYQNIHFHINSALKM